MKYIFLLSLLIASHGSFAQPVQYADDGVTPLTSGPTGGLINSTGTAGTNYNGTTGTNYSGTAGTNYGGTAGTNRAGTLPELAKPNLTIVGITNWFIQIFNYIAILLFSAALVMFLYGIFVLMFVGGASEESRSKGKKFMTWGIISLFVMTSTWGLVNVLKTSIFGNTGPLRGPQFK